MLAWILAVTPCLAVCPEDAPEPAAAPEIVPALGENACPASINQAAGVQKVRQNDVIRGVKVPDFADGYADELRNGGWEILLKEEKRLDGERTFVLLTAEHPRGYNLEVIFANAPDSAGTPFTAAGAFGAVIHATLVVTETEPAEPAGAE
jgi:hypothetical protein